MGIKSWIFLQDGKPACKKPTSLQSGWIIDIGVVNALIMIDKAFTYLAVAESRQFFTLIMTYMLSKCTQELYNVCPSEMMLKTAGEPNCLTVLFLGSTDIMLSWCKWLILNETFEPIWVRSPDASYWIYSLIVPQQVTVQCQEIGSPPTTKSSYQILLEGTGILLNSSSCYIHAKNFKLLPHSLGRTTVTLTKTHIVLPSIENILHFSEENMLQSNAIPPVNLQHLDQILVQATSRGHMRGAEVNKIVNALRDAKVHQQPIHWSWIIGIAIVSLGFGSLWTVWLRLIDKYCPYVRKCVAKPT